MLTRRELLKFSASRKALPGGYWLNLSRPAMACRFEVTLPISDQAGLPIARDALAEADRLEQQLAIFNDRSDRAAAYKNEIAEFCSAVRTGNPVRCGPEKAMRTAVACITANRSADTKTRAVIENE